ncbi:Mbeg1-like protein [Evansella sp. AB-rgal1]|uniref:Mbeg1-like protein n=1 Tax=Evansella sp. AB-rgal1 TaxID=3242696 RepID=UPI00359EB298
MPLNSLTDEEHYLLLRLSYINIDPMRNVGQGVKSLTLQQFITDARRYYTDEEDDGVLLEIKEIEEILKNSTNLQEIRLVGYQNNNPNSGNNSSGASTSGFVGYAFEDANGNAAALYRGSEDLTDKDHLRTDWYSNVEAGFGKEIQQQVEANAFYEKHVAHADGEKLLLGHSKGGNLVTHVYTNHLEDPTLQAYVVNGQPIHWINLTNEQRQSLMSDNYTFIVHTGDFVSALGFAPYVDKTVTISKNSWVDHINPIYPHSLVSVTFKESGEFSEWIEGPSPTRRIANPIVETAMKGMETLGAIITGDLKQAGENFKNLVGSLTYTIVNGALVIVETTIKGLMEEAKRTIDSYISGLKKVGQFSKKLIDGTKSFFNNMMSSARKMKDVVSGIFSGPGISIEPYMKVNLPRTAYYSARLQTIRKRINQLNHGVNMLRGDVNDVFGLNRVLWMTSNLVMSSDRRVQLNINYLNNMAALLERNERDLVNKANSLKM